MTTQEFYDLYKARFGGGLITAASDYISMDQAIETVKRHTPVVDAPVDDFFKDFPGYEPSEITVDETDECLENARNELMQIIHDGWIKNLSRTAAENLVAILESTTFGWLVIYKDANTEIVVGDSFRSKWNRMHPEEKPIFNKKYEY